MHVSVVVDDRPPATKRLQELVELAETILKPGEFLAWGSLVERCQEARRTPNRTPSEETCRRWIKSMRDAELLIFQQGVYLLNPKFQLAGSADSAA